MRIKETQADYRYFDEPDLPPLVLTPEDLAEAQARYEQTFLSFTWQGTPQRFPPGSAQVTRFLSGQTGLRGDEVAVLLDDPVALALLIDSCNLSGSFRECANWIMVEYRPRRALKPGALTAQHLADIVALRAREELNSTQAKEVFSRCFETGMAAAEAVRELGYDQSVGSTELAGICAEVIAAGGKAVADIRKGKQQAVQALVGQVMKRTRGSANPQAAEAELRRQLGL